MAAGAGVSGPRCLVVDSEQARSPAIIDPVSGAAKIRAFFVSPEHARRGIGSLLMRECEDHALRRGYRALELMATLPGKRLYERHGFIAGEPIAYPLSDGLTIQFVPMTKILCGNFAR